MREVWGDFSESNGRYVEIWDAENEEVYTMGIYVDRCKNLEPWYCIGVISVLEGGLETEESVTDCAFGELPSHIQERFTELWPLVLVAV